jgi:3-hydroxybutyryl-CoA dehydrogenase
MSELIVGIVGAGTMGEGIAQVASSAGHPVLLYDTRAGVAGRAHERIGTRLAKRVIDGKMSDADRDTLLARISPQDSLERLESCGLIIEAIVEALDPKRALFAELERMVAPQAILATNTSSLSITSLGRDLKQRERFIGLHFFNPVPVMRLVEIVRGIESSEKVVSRLERLMRTWGKTPVVARSTPGFIVNRIARPFYAEALWLLQEQRATPSQIDECLRSAGFRMGPCELMDMIGHDVNYAVTESVFTASFGDKRFVPSQVQRELVEAGHLGRKSGRGFYRYGHENAVTATPAGSSISEASARCVLRGRDRLADAFHEALENAGVTCERHLDAANLELQLKSDGGTTSVTLTRTDGRTAGQVAAERSNIAWGVFDWTTGDNLPSTLAVAFAARCPSSARELALSTLRQTGIDASAVADAPGLIVGRTIAMLVNEAADAVQQGVCDEVAADTAMKLGANYPAGPFEWLAHFGTIQVVRLLRFLHDSTHCERYRVGPWLWERFWKDHGSVRDLEAASLLEPGIAARRS